MNKLLLLSFFHLLYICSALAQVDTVSFDNGLLRMKQLPFGKNYYLVYNQAGKEGAKYNFNLWERNLKKEEVSGVSRLVLDWTWQFSDSAKVITKNIIVNVGNFVPISEKVHYNPGFGKGESKRQSIIFKEQEVVSSNDTLEHNTRKIQQPIAKMPLNWELDMETFSMLPLSKGKKFAINFYHPGGAPPAYHTYEVAGEEKLKINGKTVDCWLLKYEYNAGKGYSIWWLDKDSHLVLKMEEKFGEMYRYKIWINPELFNSLANFSSL